MAGAGLLLLPLLVIPHGSGGLLSKKAQLHHALSMYQQGEEEERREGTDEGDAEAGAAGSGGGVPGAARGGVAARAADDSLKRPLLEPGGMQRSDTTGDEVEPGADTTRGAAGPAGAAQRAAPSPSRSASTASTATLPELSPAQCLRSPNFWLLFAALTVSMGSGKAAGSCWALHCGRCMPAAAFIPGRRGSSPRGAVLSLRC